MPTYNFSANGQDFGNHDGGTLLEACNRFADDAGYKSWLAMVDQAIEVSGANNVEVREVTEHGPLGHDEADKATEQARAEQYADSANLWAEYVDPDATTPFDSVSYDERVRLALEVIRSNA